MDLMSEEHEHKEVVLKFLTRDKETKEIYRGVEGEEVEGNSESENE